MNRIKNWLIKRTGSQKIILGFFLLVLVGACLLMLPFATREGETTIFSSALLTSVSATCVTGLISYDTWSHWTIFGQLVILTEIQIGGLGFITIGTFAMIMMRKKIGLKRRAMIQDSLSTLQMKGGVKLVKNIIKGTVFFELSGALLLSIRFIQDFGVLKGIYFAVFHSVSAFCNAGFDLMGAREPFSSLTHYYDDPLVMLVISTLVIIGGLGFLVWDDLYQNRFSWKKYRFQTKIVLTVTSILLAGGTFLFFGMEKNGLFAGMSMKQKLLAAFFSAVTPRTAGFNSIDTASLTDGSLFLTILLMFIGGSPGSTAGGIKTVTLFVLLLQTKAFLLHEKNCEAFSRRIEAETVQKASMVLAVNLMFAIAGLLVILYVQNLELRDVLFEVFSAIGTSGMSTGVTRELHLVPKIVIMILMFAGRMGSLTFALAFTEHRKSKKIQRPVESITVG